jgi:hypothetical protein
VVSPTAVSTGEASPLVERARFDDGVVYELRWTPESENLTAAAADGPEPPPHGAVGFAPEETATYRCRWLSGPLTVPAGEAVISAQKTDRGFDFVVRVRTAEWVRSFFDADDTFETEADTALLSTAHRQTLNEGRRHLTRSVSFDRAARRLTVATGDEPALTMPLSKWARDPLAALFYARTLPLTPGSRYKIPMTEAGRETTIELVVHGAETIRIDDRQVDALKIEPRVIARVAVKQPLRGSVWVSRDARRIPLAIQIETEFGRFAAELVDSAPR